MTPHFLLIGDRAGSAGTNLNQGLLHFEDDDADHLGRVFRAIEHVGHVGCDNIAGARENAHH